MSIYLIESEGIELEYKTYGRAQNKYYKCVHQGLKVRLIQITDDAREIVMLKNDPQNTFNPLDALKENPQKTEEKTQITAEKLREKLFKKSKYTKKGWNRVLTICQIAIDINDTLGKEKLKELYVDMDECPDETFDVIGYVVAKINKDPEFKEE